MCVVNAEGVVLQVDPRALCCRCADGGPALVDAQKHDDRLHDHRADGCTREAARHAVPRRAVRPVRPVRPNEHEASSPSAARCSSDSKEE